jgi:hypothetical protein
MKIRLGFVSNSSSTSFCICGVYLDRVIEDNLRDELAKTNIDYYISPGHASYIGLSIHEMLPSETKAQFEKRVAKLLKDIIPAEYGTLEIGWQTDGWYDG